MWTLAVHRREGLRILRAGYAYIGVTTQKPEPTSRRASTRPGTAPWTSAPTPSPTTCFRRRRRRSGRTRSCSAAVVLGTGHSQSALRLTTYANAVQPVRGVYDGLPIHGRAALTGRTADLDPAGP